MKALIVVAIPKIFSCSFLFSDVMHLLLYVGCFYCTQHMPPILKACALIDHHNDPDYKALLYKQGQILQNAATCSTGLTLYN